MVEPTRRARADILALRWIGARAQPAVLTASTAMELGCIRQKARYAIVPGPNALFLALRWIGILFLTYIGPHIAAVAAVRGPMVQASAVDHCQEIELETHGAPPGEIGLDSRLGFDRPRTRTR